MTNRLQCRGPTAEAADCASAARVASWTAGVVSARAAAAGGDDVLLAFFRLQAACH